MTKKRGKKPTAKAPKARPRVTPRRPSAAERREAEKLAQRAAERAARREEKRRLAEKAQRAAERAARREEKRIAAKKLERAAARAERKRQRELEAKREQRAEAKREREKELRKKQRAAEKKVRKIREAAQLLEEQAKRDRRNRARRDKRRMEREGKTVEVLQKGPDATRPEHPAATPQDLVTAEMVLAILREEQQRAAEIAEARYRTHLYPETGDIDGFVWRESVDGVIGTTLGQMGDAFAPMIDGLFYSEMFFQGVATFTVSESNEAQMKKTDSPLNESRLGPNGKHYRTANTYWFKGDAQKAIAAIEYMVANIQAKHPFFDLVKVGVRTYWSPVERRPER